MLKALITVPIKYYVAALLCGLSVFAYFIIFNIKKQYIVSITAVVNIPGAMLNGSPLRFSESDTSKVNPYNRLKKDIHDLQDFKSEPAYQNHSLSIEPGTRFYNSLDVSLNAFTIREGKELLYRLIDIYNASVREKHLGQETSIDKVSYQLDDVSRQLLFLQNFSSSAHNERRLRRTAETLTALAYYVTQPVSQFSLIPNTFDLEDKQIAALISAFNEVQNKKQYLLSHDKGNADGLSILNKQLLALQAELTQLIDNDRLMVERLLRMIKSGQNKAYVQLKDSLLIIYANLIQMKADASSNTLNKRLLVVGVPQVRDDHWPMIKAVIVSLITAILLLIVLVISSQIGLDNTNSNFTYSQNNKKNLVSQSSNTMLHGVSAKSRSMFTEGIANTMRQKAINGNVFLFTTFAGTHEQLDIELAVADLLSSQNKKVVLLNTDFSEKTVIVASMELNGVGVKNFIANETITVDLLLKTNTGSKSVSCIGLGKLSVNNIEKVHTDMGESSFGNSHPDTFINHPRLKLLIDSLRSKCHYILLHASPLANPADVLPFSNAADHTMLLVQKGGLTASASSKIDALIKIGHLKDVSLVAV